MVFVTALPSETALGFIASLTRSNIYPAFLRSILLEYSVHEHALNMRVAAPRAVSVPARHRPSMSVRPKSVSANDSNVVLSK
jgi:hypothetical protein